MRFSILAVGLLFCVGCGSTPPPETPWTPVTDIPADVLTVAQKKLPQVKFDTARKISVNGQDAFEIRGKAPNGKVREVEVSTTGDVLEVE